MLHAEDPVALRAGDSLVCKTVVRRGDIVAFQRTGPNEVVWGTLTPKARAAWSGFLYRVDTGEDGQMVFEPHFDSPAEAVTGPGRIVMDIDPPEAEAPDA